MLDICLQLESQWIGSIESAKTCAEQRQSLIYALEFARHCKVDLENKRIVIYQATKFDRECPPQSQKPL